MNISSLQGTQPEGDISHKPSSQLPLLSGRPVVTFLASQHHWPWLIPIHRQQLHMREQLAYGHWMCTIMEQWEISNIYTNWSTPYLMWYNAALTKSVIFCNILPVCWNCRQWFLWASSASKISGSKNAQHNKKVNQNDKHNCALLSQYK